MTGEEVPVTSEAPKPSGAEVGSGIGAFPGTMELLRASLGSYRKTWLEYFAFIGIFFIFAIAASILSYLIRLPFYNNVWVGVAISILTTVFSFWLRGWQDNAIMRVAVAPGHFKPLFHDSRKQAWRTFFLSLFVGVITFVGFLLFLVPGFFFTLWFAFSLPAMIDENLGVIASLKRSREIVKPWFWTYLYRCSMLAVISLLLLFPLFIPVWLAILFQGTTTMLIMGVLGFLYLIAYVILYAPAASTYFLAEFYHTAKSAEASGLKEDMALWKKLVPIALLVAMAIGMVVMAGYGAKNIGPLLQTLPAWRGEFLPDQMPKEDAPGCLPNNRDGLLEEGECVNLELPPGEYRPVNTNPFPEINTPANVIQEDLTIDSDRDGLTDGDELNIWMTNPNIPDTDGDGFSDGDEVRNGYNPLGAGKLNQ